MKSSELLLKFLRYEPDTGLFFWAISPGGGVRSGAAAGCKSPIIRGKTKYPIHTIRFRGELYVAARVAWRITRGFWPDKDIDHKNCDSLDNRPDNLRLAERDQNMWNTRVRHDSVSRLKGVGYNKHARAWKAKIKIGDKQKHLGYFDTPEAAHAAYCKAADARGGEFARHE